MTETPGINKTQLRERLGLSRGVVNFHLKRLVHSGSVVTKRGKNGKEVLLFTDENQHLWHDPHTRLLFGSEQTREVALALLSSKGATSSELADRLDLSRSTVRYHLNKLQKHALVNSLRFGNRVVYQPADPLDRWNDGDGDPGETPGADLPDAP